MKGLLLFIDEERFRHFDKTTQYKAEYSILHPIELATVELISSLSGRIQPTLKTVAIFIY
jgi:hypothetical protein